MGPQKPSGISVWISVKKRDERLELFVFVQEKMCGCAHAMENIAEMQNSSRSSLYIRQLHSRVH